MTLSRNSKVILLPNCCQESESIINTIRRRTDLVNINSEDISRNEEISRVGIRSINSVGVNRIKSSVDPDGAIACTLRILGEVESGKTEDGVSVIGKSHVVLIPVDVREVDFAVVALLDWH